MSIIDFIAVVSFGLTCFSLGYNFGKDTAKSQKQPPSPANFGDYFYLTNKYGLTVYRQHSFSIPYYHAFQNMSKYSFHNVSFLKMLVGWLALHDEEAYSAWNKAVRGEHFDKIKPLS